MKLSKEQQKLTHIDKQGKAKMVDVSKKQVSSRRAKAVCTMLLNKETLDLINAGQVQKGDVFTTAKIAGIMAAKKTAELIPMCHPLNISSINIDFEYKDINSKPDSANSPQEIIITSDVKLEGKTGVEMEALTACSVAALTVYDMVKSVDKGIKITDLRLLEKTGGKSGKWSIKRSS